MGLIVRSSDIHAAGVYTSGPIKAGTHIVEYTGPRITRQRERHSLPILDHPDRKIVTHFAPAKWLF